MTLLETLIAKYTEQEGTILGATNGVSRVTIEDERCWRNLTLKPILVVATSINIENPPAFSTRDS